MQNFLWPSEDLTSARYVKQLGTVITADQALAPDNTMTADLVDMSAAAVGTGWYQLSAIVGSLGSTITRSIWLKGQVGGEVVTLQDAAYSLGTKTVTLTSNWQLYTLTSTTGATLAAGLWIIKVSGNSYYAWGASMVNANWQGDYAKTTTGIINTGRPRNLVQKQNLVNNSTNLSVAFNVTGIGSFTASGLGPNNEPNACTRITDNTNNSIHYVAPRVTSLGLGVYTVNAIVRPINGCSFGLVTTDGSAGRGIIVDGSTGTYSATTTNGSGMSLLNYSISNLPNGLLSVSVTVEFLSLIPYNVAIIIDKPKTAVWGWAYVGAGDAIEVYNIQLVKANWADGITFTNGTAVTNPIRNIVQKQNLLANSSDLTTWPKSGVFTVTGGELDPEGNSTAFKMTSNIVNPVIRAIGRLAKRGAIYTASVWLRTDTPFSTYLEYLDANDGDPPYQKKISVTTEWKRYDVTSAPLPATASLDNMNVFIGDRFSTWPIGNSLYIWQPQLTESNVAGDLQKTTGTVIDNPIRNGAQKQNLITNSQNIAAWSPTSATLTGNAAIAPDGTQTATQIDFSGAGFVVSAAGGMLGKKVGDNYTGSIWLWSNNKTVIGLRLYTLPLVKLSSYITCQISSIPQRFNFTVPVTSEGDSTIILDIENRVTNGGDGVAGTVFAWGGQVVNANWAGDYQPTTGAMITNPIRNIVLNQNLLTDPSDFASANWTKRGTCAVTSNQAISPVTGLMTADLITGMGNTGTSDIFNANYNSILIKPAGTPFTASIYIKRVSTSGILSFQNPVTFEKGLWTIDFAQLQDDVWYRVMPGMPGFTEVYKFVSGPSAGILMGASVSNFSFYVDNAQVVKANWAGNPQPNTNNSPIRNII